ncbi:MAG: hypothetical protein HBSAPP03_26740 [Phycisphaerae bacterium]|nr:MAG: hypothetical protein HBSAPP03_26740 [Phycisphaerae bacterium]
MMEILAVGSIALAGMGQVNIAPNTAHIPAPSGGYFERIPSLNEGFEGFAPGTIGGQNGWAVFAANALAPAIATSNPASGAQHLRINRGAGAATSLNGAFSPDFGDFTNEYSEISADIYISQTNAQSSQFVGQAPSQGLLTWRVIFNFDGGIYALDDADGLPGGSLAFINTGATWSAGSYFNFKVVTNPAGNSLTYYLNNSLIYTGSVGIFAGTAVEQVILFGDNQYTSSSFTDFDNVSIIPAPGSVLLAGMAGLLTLRRRR